MANIDLTQLLSDPDLCDRFVYIRRTEVIDAKGRAQPSLQRKVGYGSIQPASGQTLRLLPELANIAGVIEIWTKAPLQIQTQSLESDLIVWKGSTYIIAEKLDDFQHFGAGFTHAVCTLFDLESKGTGVGSVNAQQ